jgi:hypothetical protein
MCDILKGSSFTSKVMKKKSQLYTEYTLASVDLKTRRGKVPLKVDEDCMHHRLVTKYFIFDKK